MSSSSSLSWQPPVAVIKREGRTVAFDETKIRDALAIRAPTPDLVIYLQAPVNILLQRIRRRGINAEREIQFDYLERLNRTYTEFFHYYSDAPVLVVNAAEIDFAHNEAHFTALLQQALVMDGMRQYFNAQPTLL